MNKGCIEDGHERYPADREDNEEWWCCKTCRKDWTKFLSNKDCPGGCKGTGWNPKDNSFTCDVCYAACVCYLDKECLVHDPWDKTNW